MKKILVVDDEKSILEIIKYNLVKEGYEVLTAYDGEEALERVEEAEPGLIILDLILPKMGGLEVAREAHKTHDMPTITMIAKDSETDKALGLRLGTDDYVTRPFSNHELVARVKANLRRGAANAKEVEVTTQSELMIGDLTIHPDTCMVSKRGEKIELTYHESELLYYLAKHVGQVATRKHSLQTVWDHGYPGDVRTVDVTVYRLREEIKGSPSHPTYLVARRGVGYYLRNLEQE